MIPRRFPPLWRVWQIPGGFKVNDANGKALAYVYGRDADTLGCSPCTRLDASPLTLPSCRASYWLSYYND